MLGFVCAALGATLGAAIWAAVALATDMELGIIAWLVGAMAGGGARWGGGGTAPALQYISALWAVLGVVVAKYFIFAGVLVDMADKEGVVISYFDGRVFELFGANVTALVSAYDLLWIAIAVATAWKIPSERFFEEKSEL